MGSGTELLGVLAASEILLSFVEIQVYNRKLIIFNVTALKNNFFFPRKLTLCEERIIKITVVLQDGNESH